jgi:hypothetical protein
MKIREKADENKQSEAIQVRMASPMFSPGEL